MKILKIIGASSLLIALSPPFINEIIASTPQFNIIETSKENELIDNDLQWEKVNTRKVIPNPNKSEKDSSIIVKEKTKIKKLNDKEFEKNQIMKIDKKKLVKEKNEQTNNKNLKENHAKELKMNQIIKSKGKEGMKVIISNNQQINNINNRIIPINSKGFINIDGPTISMNLKRANAEEVLANLANIGGYGYIYIADTGKDSSKKKSRNAKDTEKEKIKRITLSLNKEPYEIALNSVLLASGLQGKKEDKIIFIGNDILARSFKSKISKVYQMNQASAASAADYLASLGALMTKVDTRTSISTDLVTKIGVTPVSTIDTDVQTYGAIEGPLKGLIGTTDSRLDTITLIGKNKIVALAERYLAQIDKRQQQVALKVKIVDILIKEGQIEDYYLKYRQDDLIFTSDPTSQRGSEMLIGSSQALINNGLINLLPNKEFFGWLNNKISEGDAQILASPTMILTEGNESLSGGDAVARAAEDALTASSIGRPFSNESFVTVGTRVITKYKIKTQKDSPPLCEATLGTAGLTFGAKVHNIDSNGYVTFSASPSLSAITQVETLPICGNMSILSVRSLDTGTIRVKDGQTILLSGVLKEDDSKEIDKTPILSDIPLLGRLFTQKNSSKVKSELVILLTPTILNDDEPMSSFNGTDY